MKPKVILTVVLLAAVCVFFVSCGSSSESEDEQEYQEAKTELERLQGLVNNLGHTVTDAEWKEIVAGVNGLYFSYSEDEASDEDKERYEKLKQDIEKFGTVTVPGIFTSGEHDFLFNLLDEEDYLLEGEQSVPLYLYKGEKLAIDMDFEKKAFVTLYNYDSESMMKTYKKVTEIHDTLVARFSAIYLMDIAVSQKTYSNISLKILSKKGECMQNAKAVTTESENCRKGDFRAKKVEGIKMNNIFEEPRKFTLRGQLKAAFSGSSRALVALQVPKGAKDILYSLRISTNESSESSDGEFKRNMDASYHKIRLLGLPIYESDRGSGLISTILGENVPPREEDAYINMYVFMNAKDARRFQNGEQAANLKYHLDYSMIGTQSCNGRIPAKGQKTIYLGFENERMRYNNYVWLEAISSVPNTEYVREKYSVSDE